MKAIQELDIQIDLTSATEFYLQQEELFQKQKWSGPGDVCSIDNDAEAVYGWALHTLNDPELPYHMYENPNATDWAKYSRTVNCVGWGSKTLNWFNKSYRGLIVVSPPGTYVQPHTDIPSKYKIHIPISTNPDCVWLLDEGEWHMPAGRAYLLDTQYPHGTVNKGTTDRVHVILELQKTDLDSFEKHGLL